MIKGVNRMIERDKKRDKGRKEKVKRCGGGIDVHHVIHLEKNVDGIGGQS